MGVIPQEKGLIEGKCMHRKMLLKLKTNMQIALPLLLETKYKTKPVSKACCIVLLYVGDKNAVNSASIIES